MSVAVHPNSPPSVTGNAAATTTTAAFNTPAGVYVIACIANDNSAASACVGTVTDNRGGTWTLLKRSNVNNATAEVWGSFKQSPLTGLTVSATFTNGFSSAADAVLSVLVLTGAASVQPGTTNAASGTVATIAIVPQATGSLIVGTLCHQASSQAYVANAQSIILKANADATSSSTQWTFQSNGVTTSLASVTYGSSTTAIASTDIVGVEILPSNGLSNNYQSFSVANGMSVGEKIR